MAADLTPTRLQAALDEMVVCMCNYVATQGGGPLCWCGLWHGLNVSWDYCGECDGGACGMGWVRVAGAFPFQTFPAPALAMRCQLPVAYQIEIGVIRCMPTITESGELPDEETIARYAHLLLADEQALFASLACCPGDIAAEAYQPLGPAGGCAGGAWTAYLTVD